MNRGSRVIRTLRFGGALRFNEAPIHESGKCEVVPSLHHAVELLQ